VSSVATFLRLALARLAGLAGDMVSQTVWRLLWLLWRCWSGWCGSGVAAGAGEAPVVPVVPVAPVVPVVPLCRHWRLLAYLCGSPWRGWLWLVRHGEPQTKEKASRLTGSCWLTG